MNNRTIISHLSPRKTNISFEIQRMEDIYEQAGGKTDHPHRHDYFTILLVESAKGIHKIDFKDYSLQTFQAFFIYPGQVHQVLTTSKPSGWAITFTSDFMIENGVNEGFIADINLFRTAESNLPLELTKKQFKGVNTYCHSMQNCLKEGDKFRFEAASAYLKLFLIDCNRACTILDDAIFLANASTDLLKRFKALVKLSYAKEHKVANYANKLNITADHLNKVVKSSLGISAKEYIQQEILVEAKRLLIFSDITFKEIAYALGFNDPAYFSNFFKKSTGESLSSFKKVHKK